MANLIVEVSAMPANAVNIMVIEVVWHASRRNVHTTDEVRRISMEAAVIAYKDARAQNVNIRAGMHNTTNTPFGLRRDPMGYHYTAEMRVGNSRWVTWHHYFELVNGAWIHKDSLRQNPVSWEGYASHANQIAGAQRDKDRIQVGTLNGTYYCVFL